jgi:hypothetical protein
MLKRVGTRNENGRVSCNERHDLRRSNRRGQPGGKEERDDQDHYDDKRSPFLRRAGSQRREKQFLLVEIVNGETVSRDIRHCVSLVPNQSHRRWARPWQARAVQIASIVQLAARDGKWLLLRALSSRRREAR